MPETTSAGVRRSLEGACAGAALLLAACGGDLSASRGAPAVVTIGPAAAPADHDPPREPVKLPGMVYVPSGTFLRGCAPADGACYSIESPATRIDLDAFYLDRTPVTVATYRACVAAGACNEEGLSTHAAEETTQLAAGSGVNTSKVLGPIESDTCNWTWKDAERSAHPINCVSWDQARAYCAWAAKRLPTEAEWEKAARGTDERIYPWGNAPPTCSLVVMSERAPGCGSGHTAPVGSRPAGRSPYGAVDMSGNVSEWVADWYAEDYYSRSPDKNPHGPPSGHYRVIRGGSWKAAPRAGIDPFRVSNRYSFTPGTRLDYIGFRCAHDAR